MVVTALSVVIVKLHVLVTQPAADPVPLENMPGVDVAGTFAERFRTVPEGMEKTHRVVVEEWQTYPSGVMPVAPVFGP